jgi:hypothetical protein
MSPEVLVQTLDGEAILLNVKTGQYFGLDQAGTRFWHILTTKDSVQTAFGELLAEYEVGDEQLRQDVEDLVGKFLDHGLVEIEHQQLA